MIIKIGETLVFLLVGTWIIVRFVYLIRHADEKVTFFWFASSMRLFLIYGCVSVLFGLYDVWVHSTLTTTGIALDPYTGPVLYTLTSVWAGFNLAGVLNSSFTVKRKFYDSISIFAFLAAFVLVGIVQIQYS